MFSGEYDERPALLTISAGAGGTEATDWAEMLLRMYLRWAERHRFATEIIDQQEGEQAGLKSVTVAVEGRRAYGWLRPERGVHRLVRISPFDAQKRRQTTFALVEVLPEVEDDIEIELDWDEIRVDTYRSQGAGGQHVNKTDSAVRLTHQPTGIVVQSQNERSQTQNKENATKVLKARLLERALEEKEAELRAIRGEHVEAGWGNQIRSYVLHPYQMVKDLRSGYETGNTGAVLDGDLDAFMQAELERLATGGEAGRRHAQRRRRRVTAPTGRRQDRSSIRFRPATDDDIPVCAEVWRVSINDYIVPLNQPEVPDDLSIIQRHYRHLRSTDPERFVVATQDDPGAVGRRTDRRLHGRHRPSARVVPVDAVRAPRGAGPGAGARSAAPRAAGRRRRDGARHRDGQRTADLERPLRAARDRAPDAAAQPDRQRPATGGVRRAPERRFRRPVRGDRRALERRRPSPARRARSTRSTASCWASSIRTTTATCGSRIATDGCTSARMATHSATATAVPADGLGRSSSGTRRCSIRCSATSWRRSSRAGPSLRGSPGRRIARSSLRCAPACASSRSRCSCAGTARRPTSSRYLPISPGLL